MSLIVVSDGAVGAFVREVAGEGAVVKTADALVDGDPVGLVVARDDRPIPRVSCRVPRLVVDDLKCADRERLMWLMDVGRYPTGSLVADRCRVATLRDDEMAEHRYVRGQSKLNTLKWHMTRRIGPKKGRAKDMPPGAGVLPPDPAIADAPLSEDPLVSVIVPTRDAPDLLEQIVVGISSSVGPRVELILVDNGTRDSRARGILGAAGARVERLDIPFNFPRLCNRGVHVAQGDIVVLLNNDVEISRPGWLLPIVDALHDPTVGIVGALLTYPDGSIQHVGISVEDGVPVHPLTGVDPDSGGATATQIGSGDRLAVTAACMALRRATYRRLGGLDPLLAHDYNDFDLCMRAWQAGYRVHLASETRLVHHESRSRGREVNPATVGDWLVARARWAEVLSRPDAVWATA